MEDIKIEETKLKTVFNSGGLELLKRTAEISDKVAALVKAIGLRELRNRLPKPDPSKTKQENEEALYEQGVQNTLEIIHNLLSTHAEETLELIGLMCYKTLDEMKDENLALFPLLTELFSDKSVLRFLSSYLK